MTGMYQDHLLQEMRKTRIAMERIAKSLEGIDKSLNRKKTISDYIQVTDNQNNAEETDIRETMHDFMKKWGEQNGLIDED